MMNSHTFMNEPDGQSLQKVLQWIYHSHDREKLFKKVKETSFPNTWESVTKSYVKVIEDLHAGKSTPIRLRS